MDIRVDSWQIDPENTMDPRTIRLAIKTGGTMSEIKDNVRETDNCFVCGKANEHGLQLDFEKQGNKVQKKLTCYRRKVRP